MAVSSLNSESTRQGQFWKRRNEILDSVENLRTTSPQLFGNFNLPVSSESVQEEAEEQLVQQDPYTFENPNNGSTSFNSLYEILSPNLQQASAGDAPVYDEEQRKKLEKLKKIGGISALAQGLMSIGALASGGQAPKFYDGLGADAIDQLARLDDNYYQQLESWQNRKAAADMYNVRANNDAAMQWARQLNDKLADEQAMDFKADEAEKERDFKAGQNAEDRKLRGRAYNLEQTKNFNYGQQQKLEAIKRYEVEYDDLAGQLKGALENFDEQGATSIQKQMEENLALRREFMSQLAEKEGFVSPEQPKPQQGKYDPLKFQEAFMNSLGGAGNAKTTTSPSASAPSADSAEVEASIERMMNNILQSNNSVVSPEERQGMIDAIVSLGTSSSLATAFVDAEIRNAGKSVGRPSYEGR